MTITESKLVAAGTAALLLALGGGVAEAQDDHVTHRPDVAFLEAHGTFGAQFGETDYLPAGMGEYQHPIVLGPGAGGTVGVMLADNVGLFASYDYTWAESRTGEIAGVIDSVEGTIDYHTAVAGLRLYVPTGYGAFRGGLGVGVLFPYHTRVEVAYGQGLGLLPEPIAGTGTQVDYYSVGFGGEASLGYQLPIVAGLYAALDVRYRLFESENAGERSEYDNYVLDFEAAPPSPTTGTVEYGDGMARPSTNSVQDVRLRLALGYQF